MSRPVATAILVLVSACPASASDGSANRVSANRTSARFNHKPADTAFASMNDDERCTATFERAAPCLDELTLALSAQLAPELAEQMGSAFPGSSDDPIEEQRTRHHLGCLGGREYTSAVMACWDRVDCKAFAACVYPPPAKQP